VSDTTQKVEAVKDAGLIRIESDKVHNTGRGKPEMRNAANIDNGHQKKYDEFGIPRFAEIVGDEVIEDEPDEL
jgi:hypothetical protein